MLLNIHNDKDTKIEDLKGEEQDIRKRYKIVEEDDLVELETAWDDVSGAVLDPRKVRQARREELKYVHKMSLYKKVPTSECLQRTGNQPISVRVRLTHQEVQACRARDKHS